MASRRFASSITLSAGTKMNSGLLSTNFLISHGQATRSTLTRSRVIHFMSVLLKLAPEWLACFGHGLGARNADIGQQPVVEFEQGKALAAPCRETLRLDECRAQ